MRCLCRYSKVSSHGHVRSSPPPPPSGADSCQYANDGACDETQYCPAGTDTSDCSSCSKFDGCCEDLSASTCGFSCSDEKSCCEAISGCSWTEGYTGGTCSGRATYNAAPCCGGVCHYDEPATDKTISISKSTYRKTLLNLDFNFWHECNFQYYYKFKGTNQDGYLWDSAMQTEEYEHWVAQTCTADFKVQMRSASGATSVALPDIPVIGLTMNMAGISVMASVTVKVTLGVSASLTFDGASTIYGGGRVQQTVKTGCRDECRPFTSDIIFEESFQALNSNNLDAVDGIRGSLEPYVTLSLTAGIMGNFGAILGDWGFKLQAGVKISVPMQMSTGYLSALSNPNRFFLTGGSASLAACSRTHSFDAQLSAKVDFTGLKGVVAIYWTVEKALISARNLMTFDLIVFCSGAECQAGQYLSGTDCTSCPAGKYKTSTGSEACTNCNGGKYSAASGATTSSTCSSCPSGKYSAASGATTSSTCSSCPSGKYSAASGASTSSDCSTCPSGSSSPSGSDSASDCTCNSGLSGPNGGPCTSCVAGKYKSSSGNLLPNLLPAPPTMPCPSVIKTDNAPPL